MLCLIRTEGFLKYMVCSKVKAKGWKGNFAVGENGILLIAENSILLIRSSIRRVCYQQGFRRLVYLVTECYFVSFIFVEEGQGINHEIFPLVQGLSHEPRGIVSSHFLFH